MSARARTLPALVTLLALAAGAPAIPAAGGGTECAAPAPASSRVTGPLRLSVSPGDSRVTFRVRKWGVVPVEGRFRSVSGEVAYDSSDLARCGVRVDARVDSVETGERARDETLQSEDFFDAARFPSLTFVSRRVARLPDGRASVLGDLTIRGVTRAVEVPVVFHGLSETEGGQAVAAFEASFRLDRTDFGVLGARWSAGRAILSRDVDVRIVLAARGPRR